MRFSAALFAFFCIAVSAAWGIPLTGETIAAYADRPVERVEYRGEFKISRSELARITMLREGMRLAVVDPDEVLQRLKKTGLFSEVSIDYEVFGESVILIVELTEKWTLIPIPVASFSKDSSMLGLIVIDSDFLGSRSMAMVGGILSNGGPTGIVQYADPTLGSSGIGLDLGVIAGNDTIEAKYMDEESFLSVDERFFNLSGRITFNEGEILRPFIGASLPYRKLDKGDAAAAELDDEYFYSELEGGFALEDVKNRGWFDEGPKATLRYGHGLALSESADYDRLALRLSYSAELFSSAVIRLGLAAESGDTPILLTRPLSGPGFRTLPSGGSFSAKYAAAYAGYEHPVAGLSWSVMTLGVFYEGGVYKTGLEHEEHGDYFHGPGFGFRLYLKNIAIPALGLDLGYNVSERSTIFTVVIGFHAN